MKTHAKIGILAALITALTTTTTLTISPAFAAPTTILNGRGTEGTYTCTDGTVNSNLGFYINVQSGKAKDQQFKLRGSWSIYPPGEFDSGIQGNIYGGKAGKTSFSLLSIDDVHFGSVCPGDATPSKGTVTGQCGQGAQIQFRSENGGHGTFTGNIVCY